MAEFTHSIKAYLYDNVLTDNPNDLIARVSSERSLSIKDICQSAVARGGADISAAAMEHAVNLWLKEMGYRLCDGFSANAQWFTVHPSIKGVFDSPSEKFSPEKHTVAFDFNQGSLLRKELATVDVQILGVADSSLFIAQVIDVKTGSVNDLLTPNRNLRISGSKIKIAGDDPDNGVYFANQSGALMKVDDSDIVNNNPSELIIVIPALAAGEYQVKIITQYSSSNASLKEPRTVTFDRVLTVV